MRRVWIRLAVLVAPALLGPTSAMAQETDPYQPVLYRLESGSTLQQGCFPPCMCPVLAQAPLSGTFVLKPTFFGGWDTLYEVRNVRWRVVLAGKRTWITGAGTYFRVDNSYLGHQLDLDLVVGNDPAQHFSSGPGRIVANPDFPRIVISISIHGEYCHDTVLRLDARPARRLHVERDELRWDPEPAGATYDVVMGDLGSLLESGGGFDVATDACVASGQSEISNPWGVDPVTGRAFWFLVRSDGGSYDDEDAGQVGSADAGIAASAAACR